MTKSENLEQTFRNCIEEIGSAFTAFPWENEHAYTAWLGQTFHYVKHTMTMITLMAASFGTRNPEGFTQAMKHLAEERGHDLLLLNDLEELGSSIAKFPEFTETSLFYQNQYYMIQNEGANAHIGYALVLEGMCAQYGPAVLKRVNKAHGTASATFLDVHVTADQGHAEAGFKELAKIDDATGEAVLKNVRQSVLLYKQILIKSAADAGVMLNLSPISA
jgi:hypothetical protein